MSDLDSQQWYFELLQLMVGSGYNIKSFGTCVYICECECIQLFVLYIENVFEELNYNCGNISMIISK